MLSGNVNITFFLGSGATLPPSIEIAKTLLQELDQLGGVSLPIDLVGAYYAVSSDELLLENRIAELIAGGSRSVPAVHEALASLLKCLANRPAKRILKGAKLPQLIVTSNLDVLMERALLRSGIPFTRIVQHGSAARIDINVYREVLLMEDGHSLHLSAPAGPPRMVKKNDFEDLDRAIAEFGSSTVLYESHEGNGDRRSAGGPANPLHALSFEDLRAPILYKFLGSQDIEGSCVISTDQYLEFARRLIQHNLIPAQISQILSSTPLLFLGSSLLDPDFRFTYQLLLRDPLAIKSNPRYAVEPRPQPSNQDTLSELRSRLWDKLKDVRLGKMNIRTVEEKEEVFLGRLITRVG
jgi:hypothetical protein